jgi:hypothetical protein
MGTQHLVSAASAQFGIPEPWRDEDSNSEVPGRAARGKEMLLGLPCARCRAYYAAQLEVCPVCGCKERTLLRRKI